MISRPCWKMAFLENPATAIAETGLNLARPSGGASCCRSGWLAAEAGNAPWPDGEEVGADVVHQVGEAMTYQPRGEMGKAATEIATYPFQKLVEAG